MNYNKTLLFNTYAHPARDMYIYLADTIFKYLGYISQPYPSKLGTEHIFQIPLYKSLEQLVNFNINDIKIITTTGQVLLDEYTRLCINIYKQIDRQFLMEICNKAYNKIINKKLGEIFTNKEKGKKWEF